MAIESFFCLPSKCYKFTGFKFIIYLFNVTTEIVVFFTPDTGYVYLFFFS